MTIYTFLFLYFFFVALSDFYKNKKLGDFLFSLSFVILVIFAGIRFDTGWDYVGYRFYYDIIPDLFSLASQYDEFDRVYFEPGFKLFISLLKSIGINFQGAIFIINFITTFLFFIFIKRSDEFVGYKNIMVLLYFSTVFLYTNFSFLRQGIAIGIWLISIKYLNHNLFRYIILVLLGCMFHYSVLIFLILPLIILVNPKQKMLLFIILISVFIYVFNFQWLNMLLPYLPDAIYSKLSHYWETERFGSSRSLGFGFIEKSVILMFLLYFYFYRVKKVTLKENMNNYVIIYFFYFLSYMMFFELTILYDRTRLYFASFSIAILPLFINFFNRKSRIIVFSFIFFYSIFMFNNIISSEQNKIVFIPYNTIFHNEELIPFEQKGEFRTNLGEYIDHGK